MGYIRDPQKPGQRYQAEVRLKGHRPLTATFDRKSDAKAWIQKAEADIRAGRHNIYAESKKRTFREAVKRYRLEKTVTTPKQAHIEWWEKELGDLFLQDVRPSVITEKKHKLLQDGDDQGYYQTA